MRLKLYCCLKTGFLEIHIYTHKFPLLNSYLSRKCEEQRLRKSQSVTNYSQNKVSTYNTFESFGTTHYCLFCGKLGSARCLLGHVQSFKVPKCWKEKSISFIQGGGRLDHFFVHLKLKKCIRSPSLYFCLFFLHFRFSFCSLQIQVKFSLSSLLHKNMSICLSMHF